MTETRNRRLPVGIQSFEEIREGGYLYVDKTDLVWQLANRGKKYNYLSRPRRFGKSVLVDTLEAYFLGKRELFEGLRIMELEREWVKRPVIRLDMSQAGAEPESVRSYLDNAFHNLETEYGIVVRQESSLAVRFKNIIEGAYNKTGQQVAILIDEYDSPLQHSWRTPHHEACTSIYREVFAILKADDKYEKFVFITGRIDMVVETIHIIYVLELKLSNNGGIDAAAEQIRSRQYAEPFKADKRRVVALAIELDDKGKGLIDWKEV